MANRKRAFRGRGISDSQRRKKTWIAVKAATGTNTAGEPEFMTGLVMSTPAAVGAFESQSTVIALISDPLTGIGDELSTLPDESTILRIRGSLLFPKSDPAPSASGTLQTTQHAFGIGVASIRSIIGGTAPTPIVDADWDGWMFLRQSTVSPVDAVGTVLDVKSMRKVRGGDALFISAETINTSVGVAADWALDLRLLILLP